MTTSLVSAICGSFSAMIRRMYRIFPAMRASVHVVAANIFLIGTLCGGAVNAQSCGPATGGSPNSACPGPASSGTDAPDAGAGNPINVITGNKYEREADMPALPGVLGLEIVRHYNSAYSRPGNRNGAIGRGWRLSYETELFDKFGKIQIFQSDGRRIIFSKNADALGMCSTANPADGKMTVSTMPNGMYDYTWTWTNGRRLSFDTAGKLYRIVARTGETVSLTYDRDNLLRRVTDPQGRSLELVYFNSAMPNHFHGVQFIDSPVGRFEYQYGSVVPKGAGAFDARQLAALMVKVKLPTAFDPKKPMHGYPGQGTTASQLSRIYHHEDPKSPWVLTGISVETMGSDGKLATARYSTFGYDADARAVLSTHANNVDKVTLETIDAGKTLLTNSLGQKTIYLHGIVAGEHRVLEVRGAGCALCGEPNVRYGYNSVGQLTETIKLSPTGTPLVASRTEFDKLGRTVRTGRVAYVQGKPQPVQWMTRFEYLGDAFAPSLIAHPSVVPGKEFSTRIAYNTACQPLSVTESGWAPAVDANTPLSHLARTTTYTYANIDGASVLTVIDGPLANGKTNSPLDSDITLIEYDNRSSAWVPPTPSAGSNGLAKYDTQAHRAGIVSAVIAPGNRKSAVGYDPAGRIATVTDADGHTTSLRYSPRGQLLAFTRDGLTHTTLYDGFDNPVESGYSEDGHYQALARLGYDGAGRNIWTASRLGIVSTRSYDTEGHLLDNATLSNTVKQAWHSSYDEFGRLRTVTDASGDTRRIGWNAIGLPDALTDALGRTMRFGYDVTGNITTVTEPATLASTPSQNTETRFELDVFGRPTAVTAPSGATTRYIRDDFGRTLATIDADRGITTRRFDTADRLVASTDANGNRADYDYDVMGRIVRQSVTDVGNGGIRDNKTTVTTWRYEGTRVVAVDHPDQAERYSYDARGRVSVKTVIVALAGGAHVINTTRYRYDALGQLAGVSMPDGSTLDYQRNGQNQITALERNPVGSPWLRWLLPKQIIVRNLERDVVGIKHMTFGNGIEALYQRSREGKLARIVYRDPRRPDVAERRSAALETLLGIGSAVAAPASPIKPIASRAAPPGALGLPVDPNALLDHRYLWDAQGNLLRTQDIDTASGYAYDARDRLIAAVTAATVPGANASFGRYHYDANGNRLLAQEGLGDQSDIRANTVKASYAPAGDRWQDATGDGGPVNARYDANGQPASIGKRSFVWDALGRLLEVRENGRTLARYRYNHRGERIEKTVGGVHTYYLYEDRRLVAELDGKGTLRRQYVYVADQPVVVIDSPDGAAAHGEGDTSWAKFTADFDIVWHSWFDQTESIVYLQNNHLGAPEMATDVKGKPVWQASYSPFGKLELVGARAMPAATGTPQFELNLRLPGQYADNETGLHYNDHRYYDPARGRYLTADPLGRRGGGNGYTYVSGNPLKFIDPSGLVLFAFDGTGNSVAPPAGDSISNVRKFYEAYDTDLNGPHFYITGIGTTDADMPVKGSKRNGDGLKERVALAFKDLNTFIDANPDQEGQPVAAIDIDVVGFSRGAAEARVWMNQLVAQLVDGRYTSTDGSGVSRCINLRFEGLWDTVSHMGLFSQDDSKYNFTIPPAVKYVAQAVALNEHRGNPIDFSARSIFDTPQTSSVPNRTELGFVGSHADIGGGYGTGDLSDAALMWIIDQGKSQGIKFKDQTITDAGWDAITNPILHDLSSNSGEAAAPLAYDRHFIYGGGQSVLQTAADIGGNDTKWAREFVSYYENRCGPSNGNWAVGQVDMAKYDAWLATIGVTVSYSALSPTPLCN